MNSFTQISRLFFLNGLCWLAVSQSALAYEIAIVKSRNLEPYSEAINGIRAGLAESKEDILITEYDLQASNETGYEIAQKITGKKTHLVFSVGTEAAQALFNRIGETPLMVTMMHDPVKELIGKKAPSASLYGIPLKVSVQTQVNLIKELVPQFASLSVDCGGIDKDDQEEMKRAAEENGLSLNCISINSKNFTEQLTIAKKKTSAFFFLLPKEPYHATITEGIILFSVRNKFPVITFTPNHVRSGALMSFSYQFHDTGLEAARLGMQVLAGTQITKRFRPSKKLIVSWNQNVSQAFGIPIPQKKDIKIDLI